MVRRCRDGERVVESRICGRAVSHEAGRAGGRAGQQASRRAGEQAGRQAMVAPGNHMRGRDRRSHEAGSSRRASRLCPCARGHGDANRAGGLPRVRRKLGDAPET